MALGLFSTIFLLASFVVGGGLLSFWARRSGAHGLEVWLPLAVMLSYAISPIVGIIVSSLILILSFILFPYAIHYLAIMIVCVIGLCFSTLMFPVNAITFVKVAVILTLSYNFASNLIMFIIGHNIIHLIKFALISTLFSWFLYLKFGWYFVMLFN
jgi:hypothetical protein